MSSKHDFEFDRFKRDVAHHQLIIVRDDGIHRHLRFQRPGSYCMHFDLITWPGYLCYTGDMGTYVFKRLEDMFQFFRRGVDRQEFNIDLSYWAEKLEAADKGDGIKEFCQAKFDQAVKSDLVEWMRNNRDRTSREERRELWDEVMVSVIDAEGDITGSRKQIAAHDFWHQVNPSVSFSFKDFWEHTVTEYTHRFIWCCCALQWGIGVYDQVKEQVAA